MPFVAPLCSIVCICVRTFRWLFASYAKYFQMAFFAFLPKPGQGTISVLCTPAFICSAASEGRGRVPVCPSAALLWEAVLQLEENEHSAVGTDPVPNEFLIR